MNRRRSPSGLLNLTRSRGLLWGLELTLTGIAHEEAVSGLIAGIPSAMAIHR